MKDKLLEAAQKRLAHLKKWLSRIKEAQERVSDVQDMVERTEWEINMLNYLPEEGQEFLPTGLIDDYARGNEQIFRSLPIPPKYSVTAVNSTSSVTTSGSSGMYAAASRAGEIDSEEILTWSEKYTVTYRHLQEKQSRYDRVELQLKALNPDRARELGLARQAYASAFADVGERVSAGIAMRNVLEHYKGDLFEKARNRPRENMTWKIMAERLTVGQVGGIEHQELINQEKEWASLQSRLSAVAKGQKDGLVANLEDIWTKLIDHLFAVLGIVKL